MEVHEQVLLAKGSVFVPNQYDLSNELRVVTWVSLCCDLLWQPEL